MNKAGIIKEHQNFKALRIRQVPKRGTNGVVRKLVEKPNNVALVKGRKNFKGMGIVNRASVSLGSEKVRT